MPEVKTKLVAKRNQYYTYIHTYRARREKLRLKYGITNIYNRRTPIPESYKIQVERINKTIITLLQSIKRIDVITEKIKVLDKAVVKFTGIKIKGVSHNRHKQSGKFTEVHLAKCLFYKYGLENGIPGSNLRDYLGKIETREPATFRTRFTDSFKTNTENKQTWLNFKRFMTSNVTPSENKNSGLYAA